MILPLPAARLAYDDLPPVHEMQRDARGVEAALGLTSRLDRAAAAVTRPAPSIHFADYPSEVAKTEITISAAAKRLADALSLHLD
jgi:hypothetical protein